MHESQVPIFVATDFCRISVTFYNDYVILRATEKGLSIESCESAYEQFFGKDCDNAFLEELAKFDASSEWLL